MSKRYQIEYNFQSPDTVKEIKDIQLVQIGRLFCSENHLIRKHVHGNWFELTCVTGGKGTIITNDVKTNVSKGDIYLSLPGDFHEINSDSINPLKYDFFSFQTTNKQLKSEYKKIVLGIKSYEQRLIKNDKIFALITYALAEMSSDSLLKDEMLYLLLKQIIIYTARSIYKNDININSKVSSKDELCFQIMHYIDTHIYSLKSLNDLSKEFKYNYSYLSDLFKQTTKSSIFTYYQARRLDTAKLMINEGKENINQIAQTLGYSSPFAFSKSFKNYFGISPKKYSQSLKKEQ